MTISSKPAKRVSSASLIFSVVFFIIILLLGRWSGFTVVSATGWLILSAALIWFVLALQFHTRSLAEQEKLDMSQLAKRGKDSTIFEGKGGHTGLFVVAQRRLQLFEKWFLPLFSAAIAAYQIGIGLYLLKAAQVEMEQKQPLLIAICMMAVAFVSFLISRYATGMSTQQQWRPLRAGGSFMLAIAVLCFALAIGMALAHFKIFVVINAINFVVPGLLVVLGVEIALNVVLDIYRPRLKEQYGRSAFDSRLLGVINEPGGIFRSAAGAIDYQFGFKVSQTWFYKLLEKAIVPLILFAAVTLYLLSCIVVVNPNEEAIIEHFGDPLLRSTAELEAGNPSIHASKVRRVGPGLAYKWPWPIDIAYKYPTKKVMELNIGFVPKTDPKTGRVIRERELLWGKSHYEEEHSLLVASEYTGEESAEGAVPVSLVKAAVPVQYRIKDLYSFIYNHKEPEKLLESICYRELTKFAASAKIEVDNKADLQDSLLGAGRTQAKEILTRAIQNAADEEKLGIEIIFLGLQGVHPPPEVAADYQKVVGAVQRKQALVLQAQAERNKSLSTIAGSVEAVDELYNLAAQYQRANEQNNQEQLEELGELLDLAFAQAEGDIFSRLRDAQSYAFEKATLARATGERFASQLKAYRAAKEIYKREQRLSVFEEALGEVRKYVVVADQNDTQVFIIDFKEKLTPSLYELGGFEELSEK